MESEVHLIELGAEEDLYRGLERTAELMATRMEELRGQGHTCYTIPVGGPSRRDILLILMLWESWLGSLVILIWT